MTPERRAELRALLASLIQPGPDPSSGVDALHWCIEGRRKIACEALAAMDHLGARERRLREAVAAMVAWHDQAVDMESADRSLSFLTRLDALRAALSEIAPDA